MESAVLCVFGVVAGVGLSYLVRAGFLAGFPTLSILITPEWILRAGGIALAGRDSRGQLSGVDGQPQRRGRGAFLRLKRTDAGQGQSPAPTSRACGEYAVCGRYIRSWVSQVGRDEIGIENFLKGARG